MRAMLTPSVSVVTRPKTSSIDFGLFPAAWITTGFSMTRIMDEVYGLAGPLLSEPGHGGTRPHPPDSSRAAGALARALPADGARPPRRRAGRRGALLLDLLAALLLHHLPGRPLARRLPAGAGAAAPL